MAARLGVQLLYKGEEETKAQYQIFPGGFTLGLVYTLLGWRLSKALAIRHVEITGAPKLEAVVKFVRALFAKSGVPIVDKAKSGLSTLAVIYALGFVFTRWHRMLRTCEPFY